MTTETILREARALYAASPSHALPNRQPDLGTECVVSSFARASLNAGKRPNGANFIQAYRLMAAEAESRGYPSVIAFNADETTAEVLAAYDSAIQEASN